MKKMLIWPGIFLLLVVTLAIIKHAKIINLQDIIQKGSERVPITNGAVDKYQYGPGNYDFSFEYDGITRIYKVHVPGGYDKNKKTPVVLALHGGGGNAEDSSRFFQLTDLAEKESFIIVYPQATGKKNPLNQKIAGEWNVGIAKKGVVADDVGYFSAMIDKLKQDFKVDAKRVYATGHSQGALMSHRLACELSDKIAAIAVGGAHGTDFPPCAPTRPVAIFHFHGMQDKCSPFNGGICGCVDVFPQAGWSCRSLPVFIDDWKKINKCADRQAEVYKNKTALCTSYTECADGVEVELCTVDNMGHTWPGNDYGVAICDNPNSLLCQPWKKLVGSLSNDMKANEMIWAFFQKHSIK